MTTFVLVPGFWIGGWAWDGVAAPLRAAGHQVHSITLTGVAEKAHLATPETNLDTHTDDIVRLIEDEDLRDVVLVGHSGGGMPVTQAADRVPERIKRVVYVESGPLPEGVSQFDTNEPAEQERLRAEIGDGHLLPARDWDAAADPVLLAGLDEATLAMLRERSTPHPLGAATQPVRRTGAGDALPVALVACVFPLDQVKAMVAEGHPFFAAFQGGEIRGLPTGHWPMLSEPKRLAEILAELG
ncbi:alpha/beta fold hydrolase [Phytohabitans sp. LJ34]|uniref:alpha/beta fold hydrolase n=1 Tax=Phytohabitans sp. LJ34 TaxID=3452217 RepID=UPI003F8C0C92